MSRIELKAVRKEFGTVGVINGIDLDILDGGFTVFVGPSGCGKSTLLRLIAGLEDLTSGHILIDGKDVTELGPAQRELAMVFQSYALYPHMSVRNNIGFPLKMAKQSDEVIAAKVNKAAETLNLTPYLDRRPGQLSGGQRQRVAIGRAIVREPKAFLFDEPLSNLDAALRVQMRLEIMQLHTSLGATMVYVTHDQVEAMTMADRIVVLNQGKIEQVGSPLELYDHPKTLFVAGFIGSPKMNFISGDVASRHNAATIGIRPEHIGLGGANPHFTGTIRIAEHLGSDTFIHVDSAELGAITVRATGNVTASSGMAVSLTFDPSRIHRFDTSGLAIG